MKLFLIVLLALIPVSIIQAQASTPPPMPIPTQEMFQALATANAQVDALPDDLTRPNNASVLTNERGRVLFGYIKYLLSPSAADEWAGPFAPIFQHIGLGMTVLFTTSAVYGAAYVIGNAGAWVGWLIEAARKTLDLLMQILQAAVELVVVGAIIFVIYKVIELLVGEQAVQNWISEQLDNILTFVYDIAQRITGGF